MKKIIPILLILTVLASCSSLEQTPTQTPTPTSTCLENAPESSITIWLAETYTDPETDIKFSNQGAFTGKNTIMLLYLPPGAESWEGVQLSSQTQQVETEGWSLTMLCDQETVLLEKLQ